MPDENSIPFLEAIKAGYVPGAQNTQAAEKLFDLVAEEAQSLTEVSEKAGAVASAARQAMQEVLKGGQVWTTVLEAVGKKLLADSGNIDAIRELVALQDYVKENLPTLSQGKLEQKSDGKKVDIEQAEIVAEIMKMVMESLEGKLTNIKSLPSRDVFVQALTEQVIDLKRRLGVTGKGALSTAVDELIDCKTKVGYQALRQVNKRYSQAKIESFLAQFETKPDEASEADEATQELSIMSPQGEIYAAFLRRQLEVFHVTTGKMMGVGITQQEEQFLSHLCLGIGGGHRDKLADVLTKTPSDNRADRAAGEAVRMAVEGGTLNDYWTALSQMDAERREAVFDMAFIAWDNLPGSAEEKTALAKLILIAHDVEVDGDSHKGQKQKLIQSIPDQDLASLRREAKAEIIQQTIGDLKNELFTLNLADAYYSRLNIPEQVRKLVSGKDYESRDAASTLAKQEIFQNIVMSLVEKALSRDMIEAQQQIGEMSIALRQSQNLEYDRYSERGMNLRLDRSTPENQALKNQESIVFLANYVRMLLIQLRDQYDAVKLQTQYFIDAEKFGVQASTLIELHNTVSTAIAAYNKKIESTHPDQYNKDRAPIEFVDYMMLMKSNSPALPIFLVRNFTAKGFRGFDWEGRGKMQGYSGLYSTNEEDPRNNIVADYLEADTLRTAQSMVDKSEVVPLLTAGADLGKIEQILVQHEILMEPGKFASMYEPQQASGASRYDNIIAYDPFVKARAEAAEQAVFTDEQAIKQAVEKLANAGKKGDELWQNIERWGWSCERDYGDLSTIEKGLIKIGRGRSELAQTKRKYEEQVAALTGGEKFNLLESSERIRLQQRLERLKKNAQSKYVVEIATKVKNIKDRVAGAEVVAKQYIDSLITDAEIPSLNLPDYSNDIRNMRVVAVHDIDTTGYGLQLQVIYRTFQKAEEAYGKKVFLRVKNLLTNRGVFGEQAKAIDDAMGELRLQLGYKEAIDYSYSSGEPQPPKVDLSVITKLLLPLLREARIAQTKTINFDAIKPEAFFNMPGGSDETQRVAAERIGELKERKATLLKPAEVA
ncbi:hypothetical protein KJ707_01605 [Patescibacteria group bacterium]|nr:hypothetical protein [Patescibacteria group bacterium]